MGLQKQRTELPMKRSKDLFQKDFGFFTLAIFGVVATLLTFG